MRRSWPAADGGSIREMSEPGDPRGFRAIAQPMRDRVPAEPIASRAEALSRVLTSYPEGA